MLDRRRSHVLGVVITDVDSRHSTDYYYYGGYYNERESKGLFSRRRGGPADIDLVDAETASNEESISAET